MVEPLQSCYKIVRRRMTHQQATYQCKQYGPSAHLVSIDTMDEYRYIFGKIWNQPGKGYLVMIYRSETEDTSFAILFNVSKGGVGCS